MRRRSRAGGEPAKAQRRKTGARKSRIAPKAVRSRNSSAAREETEIARLTRERDEALQRQTAIADENARLHNELRESLQQQTGTADVLKVISRSTFDLQTVLDTLLESAARLCEARRAVMARRYGDSYHGVAFYNASPEIIDFVKRHPIKPGRHAITARVALERRTIHVADLQADPEYKYVRRDVDPIRTELGVPMFRGNDLVGVIILYKLVVEPFTDKQIKLVETFADQAVIAIENTRLFEAEQQRTRELAESLEQQTATSDVLSVISSSPGALEPVFATILENATRICDAKFGNVYLWDSDAFQLVATHNTPPRFAESRKRGPFRPGPRHPFSRLVVTKQIFHVDDVAALPGYAERDPQIVEPVELGGIRTCLGVPMLKNNNLIGALVIFRQEVRPFNDKQIELVQNFAAQAVIAIENTRLLNELRESLQQQTGTADVLKVISRSTFDLQTVLDTLIKSAAELCAADKALIFQQEGASLRLVANYGFSPEAERYWLDHPPPVDRGSITGRALLEGRAIHVADVLTDSDYRATRYQELAGYRTVLAVPLLRGGTTIGVFGLTRDEVNPFTEKQIELVTTFADQAVIAIENVRLFEAEQHRTRELTESLEQQTATSEVLQVISSSPGELSRVFEAMLERAVRISGAKFGNLWLREGDTFLLGATHGTPPAFADCLRRERLFGTDPRFGMGQVVRTKQTYQVADLAIEPTYEDKLRLATIDLGGARSLIGVPLLKDGEVIGCIVIYRQEVRPFTDKQIELVTNFAAQAVIAIENTRLLNELRESLTQQTATADVLKVISRSTFDLQSVLNTLIESAARLCGADMGNIQLREADVYRIRAHYGLAREAVQYGLLQPLRPGRSSVTGRVALDGKAIHIPDVLADPEYHATDYQQAFGFRTILGVPLLRDGATIGVFCLTRVEVSPFNDKQIELVTIFADQAVIAMENARLLTELRESLQQQSATADVLKVISRSTFDLRTVLDTLVESAARLCDADSVAIHRPDGNSYPFVASYGYTREYHEYMRERPIIPGRGTVLGRAVAECKPIQVNDVEVDPEYTLREGQRLGGFRTVLGIPLLREGVPIGVIVLTRNTVRPFTDKQIELATTFADQAAIAIQNVRLFEAEQQRTQELARSLEELRTAQDRLVQTQKLASLGQLTAGIAHEIKNPLNFVNNFSGVSAELIDELQENLGKVKADANTLAEITELTDTLRDNLGKIVQHGKRADAIVKNMLLHSREGLGEHRPVDVNALVEESLNLAYHGARAEKQGFNITLERSFDPAAGEIDAFPQEITRVLLNLISNGFYASTKRKGQLNSERYEPALRAATKDLGDRVEIRIRDNGTGVPPEVRDKLFNPFFTTKPAGEGTGLGLSISHDIIVKQHGGSIEVDTLPGEFTEFKIILPRVAAFASKSGGGA
jgi:two-component system NtrC family sensor kinase